MDELAPEPIFDPLAEIIATAMHGPQAYARSWIDRAAFNAGANAVRTYLESPEVVERVARAIIQDLFQQERGDGACLAPDCPAFTALTLGYIDQGETDVARIARAALQAAGGKGDAS